MIPSVTIEVFADVLITVSSMELPHVTQETKLDIVLYLFRIPIITIRMSTDVLINDSAMAPAGKFGYHFRLYRGPNATISLLRSLLGRPSRSVCLQMF